MNTYKQLLPRTIFFGSLGLAAILLVSTPSCRAQEVNPAIFTDTGVEDAYPAKKPLTKNAVKVETASHPTAIASAPAIASRRKSNPVARKQNTPS
jgi:hypothetical protein